MDYFWPTLSLFPFVSSSSPPPVGFPFSLSPPFFKGGESNSRGWRQVWCPFLCFSCISRRPLFLFPLCHFTANKGVRSVSPFFFFFSPDRISFFFFSQGWGLPFSSIGATDLPPRGLKGRREVEGATPFPVPPNADSKPSFFLGKGFFWGMIGTRKKSTLIPHTPKRPVPLSPGRGGLIKGTPLTPPPLFGRVWFDPILLFRPKRMHVFFPLPLKTKRKKG